MRVARVALLVFCIAFTVGGQVVNRAEDHQTSQLELRLFAVKPSIRSGEPLKLRVELWNVGTEDVIVAQNLNSTFGNSTMSMVLQAGLVEESHGDVADRFPSPDEPDFERTFVTNWLTLNKNHFYGTYVYMDPIEFPHLRKRGRYRIHAQYFSRGISSTPGWNGGFLRQADVDKLPLRAFKGTLNSNDVSIQVTAGMKNLDKRD